MKPIYLISFLFSLVLSLSNVSGQIRSTSTVYEEYLRTIKQVNIETNVSDNLPVERDLRSVITESCGHRLYNPHAFDLQYQRAYEERLHTLILEHRQKSAVRKSQIMQIPVVVHVIHQGQAEGVGENISVAQIQSQIQALNDAFNRTEGTRYANTDNNAGLDYNQLTSSSAIEFVLATVSPLGNPTNGINRVEAIEGYHFLPNYINDIIKPATVWNPSYYLNLWSTRLTDGVSPGLLGYAVFPTMSELEGLGFLASVPNADGIVCDYRTVGSNDYEKQFDLNPAYQYGVTTIHEVGHFLGLRHIWGDGDSEDTGCNVDDFVDDTPNAAWRSSGCDLNESCESIDLKENYMDYGSDVCKNLMTNGQNERMLTVLESSPRRNSLITSPVLSGNPPPSTEAPMNDLCQNAIIISCGQTKSGSTDNSTVNGTFTGLDGRLCSGAAATHGVWFSFKGEGDEVTLKTSGSGTKYDATIHVFTGPCDNLECVGGHDDESSQFSNTGSDLVFLAEEGIDYFIYVSGKQGETGDFSLSINCSNYSVEGAPSNDVYTQAVEVFCGSTVDGSTDGSSIDAIGSGDCGVDLTDIGVWYKFIGTDELITVSTCTNISFDTKIAIFEGTESFWGCFAQNNNGGGCDKGSTKKFFGADDKTYLIWVGGSEEGDFTLSLTCEPAPDAPVNIVFSKQQQIDSFPIKYPSTTEIVGDVIISHELINKTTIIHNLQPLAQLLSVGGNLIIQENIWDAFSNLDGLENIATIGGDLIIQDNAALRSLDGLQNLTAVNGNLILSGFSIQTFEPLSNLASIGGNLELYGRRIHRELFNDFNAFNNLESLGGSLILDGFWTMDTLSGFSNISSIPGDLMINGMWSILRDSGLIEIQAFDPIVEIGGDLIISNNEYLTNPGNFQDLVTIQESLVFDNNDGLTTISGPLNLENIGGDFIYRGDVIDGPLQVISGFNSLMTIGGDFEILSGTLTSINELNNLDSIGGNFWTRFSKLDQLNGMQNLRIIGDSLYLNSAFGNDPINNFLPGLEKVGKSIFFDFNLNVPSFDGFHNLMEVGEDVFIIRFNRSKSIVGFDNVTSISGSLIITDNIFNEVLNGFQKLGQIGGDLILSDNTNLVQLNAFDSLKTISGSLVVDESFKRFQNIPFNLPKLVTISQETEIISSGIAKFTAPNLTQIGSDFSIGKFNFDLDTFELNSLKSIGGSFVFDSSGITKLIGLENLKTIGGDFKPSTSLFSFENTALESIGGNFILDTMRFLRDIDELESLQSIGDDLVITQNPKLTNLSGFTNLMSIEGNLTIQDNPTLSDCQGICSVINQTGIEGNISISGNNLGCLNFEEVQTACAATPVTSYDLVDVVSIFPNPFEDQIMIDLNGLPITSFEILDIRGKKLLHVPNQNAESILIKTDKLINGLYILHLYKRDGHRLSKKMIKQ